MGQLACGGLMQLGAGLALNALSGMQCCLVIFSLPYTAAVWLGVGACVPQEMELAAAFNVALHVPRLAQAEQRSVLQQLGAFSGPDVSPTRPCRCPLGRCCCCHTFCTPPHPQSMYICSEPAGIPLFACPALPCSWTRLWRSCWIPRCPSSACCCCWTWRGRGRRRRSGRRRSHAGRRCCGTWPTADGGRGGKAERATRTLCGSAGLALLYVCVCHRAFYFSVSCFLASVPTFAVICVLDFVLLSSQIGVQHSVDVDGVWLAAPAPRATRAQASKRRIGRTRRPQPAATRRDLLP